ncbi:membrane-bound O-acyltransferase family protein, partial [Flavobacterium psychrotolerans]
KLMLVITLLFVLLMFIIEWIGRDKQYGIGGLFTGKSRLYRWGIYYVIILLIFIFAGSNQQFIYFQF